MSMAIPLNLTGPLTATPSGSGLGSLASGLGSGDSSGGFGDVLKNAINQVSNLEGSATQQVGNLMQGGNADMSKVMISVEKADVAFQLMMQVRNKIVSAYQDIEKMQF
jgi:flagellar hook-basal body complex protein FliE